MEFKINKTLFEVDALVNYLNLITLMSMSEHLNEAKTGLEESRDWLVENAESSEHIAYVDALTEQIEIVGCNLNSLKIALLMKEADTFNHDVKFEKLNLHMFGLN